ncbi:hypothetical protein F2Q70_00041373, partial [Brassica cretica]
DSNVTEHIPLLTSQEVNHQNYHEAVPKWPWLVYLAGAMGCLICSSVSHLLACHSKRYNLFFWRLDYAGISLMIVSSFFAPIYYAFSCHPNFRFLYLSSISILGLLAIITLLAPALSAPRFRPFRAYLFLAMGFCSVVPASHVLCLYWGHPNVLFALACELATGLSYAVGAVFYVSRVPERWKPGAFDIAGHSHQIFHVFVVLGALVHCVATLVIKPTTVHFHGNLIESFESHDSFAGDIKGAAFTENPVERNELSATRRLFTQDPPWISALFLKGLTKMVVKIERKDIDKRKFDSLRRRQVKEETEAWERMVDEYRDLEKEMCEKSLAPNLPYVKHTFLGWFQPLKEVIEREQRLQKNKSKKVRAAYAPHIELLPADKMAVIVMHKMMGLVMSGHEDGCIQVVQAAVSIGIAIEHEVRIHNFLKRSRKNNAGDSQEELKDKQLLRKRVNSLIRRKRIIDALKVVKSEGIKPWGRATQAKLGSRLLELLIETAYVQPPLTQSGDSIPEFRPAFRHKFKTVTKYPGSKLVRRYGVIECDSLLLAGLDKSAKHMLIPYVPMLVPPKRWRGYDKGGYLFLPSYIMRTHGSKKQQDALKDISSKTAHRVFEALDTLGNTKWRVNRKILDVVERLWADGGNIAGLVNREDVPIPEKPSSEDPEEIQSWKWSVRKAKKTNRERHSLRCDVELKLSVARKMKDEEGFYYPHNLDFRGRAYPMHPHLNHLSSDLCRGTLEFAEGRPLGKSGLYWLKIHFANLYAGGVEKLSHEGRLAFVENHLDDIMDSAENAIHGRRWWLKAEDPFQCLAACVVLAQALKSPSPYSVISHLPIHQDGSCNGLQHYAALGRDSVGSLVNIYNLPFCLVQSHMQSHIYL